MLGRCESQHRIANAGCRERTGASVTSGVGPITRKRGAQTNGVERRLDRVMTSDNRTLSDMTVPTLTSAIVKVPALVEQTGDRARAYMRASRAENTRRAYAADWRNFTTWASSAGLLPLPAAPETVGLYLAAEAARLRPGTLARHLVAITAAHRAAGHQLDTRAAPIRETLSGIKRTHGTNQNGKAPAVIADLRAMIAAQPDTLAGLRNRALLLLGSPVPCGAASWLASMSRIWTSRRLAWW